VPAHSVQDYVQGLGVHPLASEILVVGLNHNTAPVAVRERVTFPKEGMERALTSLTERVGEGVILSTCNRTEVYCASVDPADASDEVLRFISDYHGLTPEAVSPYVYRHGGPEAVRHLFRVAAGLDSMIVGESQILGQVREALVAASDAESVRVSLAGLFHSAIRTGRKVRAETDIGRNALSISYAGVQFAERVVGRLAGRSVLLIGAGDAGRLVARALQTVGVGQLVIANRTKSRAEEVAHDLAGKAIGFPELETALGESDIVLAATDAPEYVVTESLVRPAVDSRRHDRPLFLFDLAVPRDIDPSVSSIDGVHLYNIDDLSSIAEQNLEQRKRAAAAAERIIEGELDRFTAWWDSLDAAPIVRSMWQQAEEIRRRELDRALDRMKDLPPEQVEIVEALTRSIVKKLLHDPTSFLKERADRSQLESAEAMFKLWKDQ